MALCLNWWGICCRIDKARAIKWVWVFAIRRRILELPALLIPINTQQPRPCLSILPDSARSRIALKSLTLLLLSSEPKENCAENRDDTEQTKDSPEKRWDVARHSII